jgi:hypothetical protein
LGDERVQAVAGVVIGAAYALVRALELEYADATGTKRAAEYAGLLADTASTVASEGAVPRDWASPFYFNDALIRLAVSAERMDQKQEPRDDRPPTVREEVNIFKHEFGGLFARGRRIGVEDAIAELATLVAKLTDLARQRAAEQ